MARKPKSKPVFVKVLIDNFQKKLALPPLFAKILREKLPEKPVLETDAGESWVVKLKKIGDKCFFTEGWPEFVEDHELEAGDFLIFRLISDSIFKVEIFGRTCCLKSVESATRERTDDDSPTESAEIPENPFVGRTTRSSKTRKSPDYAGVHGSSSHRRVEIKSEASDETDDSVKTVTSCFVVVYKDYMRSNMAIPRVFAVNHGIVRMKRLILKDQRGRQWIVDIKIRQTSYNRVDMTGEWGEFRRVNKLMNGDTCLFQFVPGVGVDVDAGFLLCKVIKKVARARGRPAGSSKNGRV